MNSVILHAYVFIQIVKRDAILSQYAATHTFIIEGSGLELKSHLPSFISSTLEKSLNRDILFNSNLHSVRYFYNSKLYVFALSRSKIWSHMILDFFEQPEYCYQNMKNCFVQY